jgi:endonuclease IV
VLIEFEGTLTLSLEAIKELAEVAGFSVNEEALELERDIAHLTAENARLTTEAAGYRDIIEGFGKVIAKGTKK